MSIFSKIGGALKGAANVATAPQRAIVDRFSGSHGPAMGPAMIPGVGGLGGMLSHAGPMPPMMGGMAVAHPTMPGSTPPPAGVLAGPQAPMAGQMGGPMGAAPGGIMAILRAQMQKSQGPDASSLLQSQYPGMGSNQGGNE